MVPGIPPGAKGPAHAEWNTQAKVIRDPGVAVAKWERVPTLGMGAVHLGP